MALISIVYRLSNRRVVSSRVLVLRNQTNVVHTASSSPSTVLGSFPDSNFSLQQACHKFVMTKVQVCHKFVMTKVQACHKFVMTNVQVCHKFVMTRVQACSKLAAS
ncbi:hypothetical protein AVEN_124807-1 [Araneus ventricosus]|uniref:Uncharacterized protein n=1 Tax=Araneus ventricosus TaxID=182803 RepID=A0A4Y2N9R5_ARAVE|nr:hypothetical protein AVEN_124807-1 [Araneus ventricosus]